MVKENPEVNEIIRQCLDGDQKAWERLYNIYRPMTRSHVIGILKSHNCLGFLGNHLDGIINYIFEELFIYLPKYNFTNFDIWFSMLRTSKTFDYIRREIRYERKKGAYQSSGVHDGHASVDSEVQILHKEVRSFVDSLPRDYAIPLKLFYFEGLSYNEIAHLLNMKPFAVGMRITRAKRKLRSMLAPPGDRDRTVSQSRT